MKKQSLLRNITLVFIMIMVCFMFGCKQQVEEVDPTAENRALAHRWNDEVWNKADTAAMDEILAENIIFNYAPPGIEQNLEGYKQTVASYHNVFSDMVLTIEDMIAEGDKVVVRWSGHSIHSSEYMGIPPTGKEVGITGISIIRIEGGKIVEEWTEMDSLGMMMQLGAFPPSE
ncbi:MAG: ester cyclase [Candidatus Aminicenantaceae bacterium]